MKWTKNNALNKIDFNKTSNIFLYLEISFNDTNFKNWCTSSRVPAGYKDLCAFSIQNDQLQSAFAFWIEYLYLQGFITILFKLSDKHTNLGNKSKFEIIAVSPLTMFSIIQPLFLQKLSLYIHISNIYLGLGFQFGPQRMWALFY